MAIDHFFFIVPEDKFKECVELYAKALEPLGYQIVYEVGEYLTGFGSKHDAVDYYKAADLWVKGEKESVRGHLALRAPSRSAVDAFHATAVLSGGKDNGAPGVRARYHPSYYAAFVIDAAGNNIEVVCHEP